jgi:hypothetical protein
MDGGPVILVVEHDDDVRECAVIALKLPQAAGFAPRVS